MIFANFFGAGVVIGTAFIHMVIPAIKNLTNECLGRIVTDYEPLPLLIVMGSIFLMHLIEFIASRKLGGHADLEKTNTIPDVGNGHSHHHGQHSGNEKSRNFITLLLFELGIALHSVIIGISLGVITGSEFRTLLIALCFHQFFEGFALGSAVILTEPSKRTSVLTVLAFASSTPIGVAIGIGVHSTFNENDKNTLLVVGIFEALAAGALIYTGLIELLTFGLTLNPTFSSKGASIFSIASAFLGLYSGATAMAVIGKWA
jgi:zinc transporter 1/2/3